MSFNFYSQFFTFYWQDLLDTVHLFETAEQLVIFFLDRLPQPSGHQLRHYEPRRQPHEQPVQGII